MTITKQKSEKERSARNAVFGTPELLAEILSYLAARDTLQSRMVCRNWYQQNRISPSLRRYSDRYYFINRGLPRETIQEFPGKFIPDGSPWDTDYYYYTAVLHPLLRCCGGPRWPRLSTLIYLFDAMLAVGTKQICQPYTTKVRLSLRGKGGHMTHHTCRREDGVRFEELVQAVRLLLDSQPSPEDLEVEYFKPPETPVGGLLNKHYFQH